MSHDITIGPAPETRAAMQAALIRGDVTSGNAQPPGDHVRYEDKGDHGPSRWPNPAEVNGCGKGSCNSLPRAAAPFVDASHVGVTKDGTHAFLVTRGKPGDSAIAVGPDGHAVSEIPAERIKDVS